MTATQAKALETMRIGHPLKEDVLMLCRTEGPCISIFLHPHRAGSGTRASGVELAGMMARIGAALEDCGMHRQDVAEMVAPLEAMATEPGLLASHRETVCIYRSRRAVHCYTVRPEVEAGWHVEERFVVTPLLEHLDYRQSFLLLALAGKHIRLLRSDAGELTPVALPLGVPESAEEFIGGGRGEEHTKNHAAGVRFGSSNGKEKSGHFRRDFMKAIDRGLQPLLRQHGLPLVLAGVEEETAAYAAVSEYAELLAEPVRLSPDGGATYLELAMAAEVVLSRWSNAAEQEALAEYRQAGPGRRVTEYAALLQAARGGKIHHLFVERGARMAGDCRRMAGEASEGYVYRTDDVMNAAAVEVLLHKGMVWLLEPEQMPVASVIAAVLRYAGDKTGQ